MTASVFVLKISSETFLKINVMKRSIPSVSCQANTRLSVPRITHGTLVPIQAISIFMLFN